MMFTQRKIESLQRKRERLPWPSGKPFKILSLDGGGIRGVYASTLLRLIEDEFGPCSKHFDLIAGTSTGGIIAVGLGLGISAQQIDDLYVIEGEQIFPRSSFPLVRFFQQLFGPIHDHEVLEQKLKENFGNSLLGESSNRLVIPAFVGPNPQLAVFKTDHHPDYKRDWKNEAWRIARATSAAPTFYEGHGEGDAYFLDGGVWANNPILCAVVEAITAYEVQPSDIRVISVGTGSALKSLKKGAIRSGFIGWRKIIEVAMGLTADSALGQARLFLGPDSVLRLDPIGCESIGLDDWQGAVHALPDFASLDFLSSRPAIGEFFKRECSDRERYFT